MRMMRAWIVVGLGAGAALGCGARAPQTPAHLPAPAAVDESDVRQILGTEPVRVGPALPAVVEHSPSLIPEGTAFYLKVRPADGSAPFALVEGRAADRSLAFTPAADGSFWTIAPAPLDAREVAVDVTIRYLGGAVRTEARTVAVAPREFLSERLSVAPQFTNPPPAALKRIQAERELVAETVRRVTPEVLWSQPFAQPREGRVTSVFGSRRMFNEQVRSRHLGYDIDGERGDPIYASNRGRAALARDLYFSGNTVYLDHGLGLYTAYFHMSEILVEEGEWVERGQLIGRVGATGRVTGPHLHWSVSFQGIALDPEHLLALGPPPPGVEAPETAPASPRP